MKVECHCWTRVRPGLFWREGSVLHWWIPVGDPTRTPIVQERGDRDCGDEDVARNFVERMVENQVALYGAKEVG